MSQCYEHIHFSIFLCAVFATVSSKKHSFYICWVFNYSSHSGKFKKKEAIIIWQADY